MKPQKLHLQIDSLSVFIIRQADMFVAYSPALDFSTYGETLELARERFTEAVEIFFEETLEKGTLFSELENLGWSVDKKHKKVSPPVVVENTIQKFDLNIGA